MTPIEAIDHMALRGIIQQLRADNARLRAALESAPNPATWSTSKHYIAWYHGARIKALKGEE